MELLPEVQRQQVKSGQLPEIAASSVENIEMPAKSDFTMVQEPTSTSLLIPSSTSSLGLGMDHLTPFSRSSVFENQTRLPGSINVHHSEVIKYGSQSILYGRGLRPRSSINKDFNLNDSTPETRRVSLMNASLSREINRATFGNLQNSSPEMEQNGFINQLHDASPLYSYRLSSNPIGTPSSNQGLFKDSGGGLNSSFTGKRIQSDRDYRLWNGASSDDQMEISWR